MFNRLTTTSLIAALSLSTVAACQAEATTFDFSHQQHINAGVLNVGYVDIGPKDGQAVICCTAGHTMHTVLPRSPHSWLVRATG